MKKTLYGIKDNVRGEFVTFFDEVADGVALRSIKNQIVRPSAGLGMLNTNTEDFSVYILGSYEPTTGVIESKVEFLVNCVDLKRMAEDV